MAIKDRETRKRKERRGGEGRRERMGEEGRKGRGGRRAEMEMGGSPLHGSWGGGDERPCLCSYSKHNMLTVNIGISGSYIYTKNHRQKLDSLY
jgi:hypothetical protein